MIKTSTQKSIKNICLSIMTVAFLLCSFQSSAQKSDTVILPTKSKLKPVSRAPEIKANVPVYKAPSQYKSFSTIASTVKTPVKSNKILTINKIYPNPVTDQVNIVLHLEKETHLSIRIVDQLGNNVVTLLDEKTSSGDVTKSFTLPKKLNTGMYYLRVIAGQETIAKRISVL